MRVRSGDRPFGVANFAILRFSVDVCGVDFVEVRRAPGILLDNLPAFKAEGIAANRITALVIPAMDMLARGNRCLTLQAVFGLYRLVTVYDPVVFLGFSLNILAANAAKHRS